MSEFKLQAQIDWQVEEPSGKTTLTVKQFAKLREVLSEAICNTEFTLFKSSRRSFCFMLNNNGLGMAPTAEIKKDDPSIICRTMAPQKGYTEKGWNVLVKSAIVGIGLAGNEVQRYFQERITE